MYDTIKDAVYFIAAYDNVTERLSHEFQLTDQQALQLINILYDDGADGYGDYPIDNESVENIQKIEEIVNIKFNQKKYSYFLEPSRK